MLIIRNYIVKKHILFGILLVLILVLVALIITRYNNMDKPSIWIKKDMISNFESAKYLRINTETLAAFNGETKKILTLSEIDYLSNKLQMHSFFELDGKNLRQDYYRDGNTIYKNFNGTWQTEQLAASSKFSNSIEVVNRLRSINEMTYVKNEKLNYVDSYVLISKVPEDESLVLVNGLFNNAIVGSSGKFVIKNATSEWWVNIDTKQLARDIRIINAEIDGYPLQVIWKNSYAGYNEPLNITLPKELM